jgi:hypothetical protein
MTWSYWQHPYRASKQAEAMAEHTDNAIVMPHMKTSQLLLFGGVKRTRHLRLMEISLPSDWQEHQSQILS